MISTPKCLGKVVTGANDTLKLQTKRATKMKSEFKAKYLQHLVRKHKGNEGFTLIELLVVIIIVGVLAAIALPSFLNQIGKARGSEAKTNIGVINRAQQAYRLENQTFTGNVTNLDAKLDLANTFYSYTLTGGQYTTKTVTGAGTNKDLKLYAGGVAQSGLDSSVATYMCESTVVAGDSAAVSNVTLAADATTAATGSCPTGTKLVK